MPLYNWHCTKCEQEIDVLRTFDDYEKGPTDEEADPEPSMKSCPHEWERKIAPVKTIKGIGWGKKGHWILLFSCIGAELCIQWQSWLS